MMNNVSRMKNGLIVSCVLNKLDPMNEKETILKLAIAAEKGGASAVKVEGLENIKLVKSRVKIPVIGSVEVLSGNHIQQEDISITPTIYLAEQIYESGADMISIDCTIRKGRSEKFVSDFIKSVRLVCDSLIMAEISNLEEGQLASASGVDIISTSLSNNEENLNECGRPSYNLVEQLKKRISTPINAEGNINYPADARNIIEKGAYCVTVGHAIISPEYLTKRINNSFEK